MGQRHKEDGLGGVVEAALNHCMLDEEWLQAMVEDDAILHETKDEVYQALESFICDHLARIT